MFGCTCVHICSHVPCILTRSRVTTPVRAAGSFCLTHWRRFGSFTHTFVYAFLTCRVFSRLLECIYYSMCTHSFSRVVYPLLCTHLLTCRAFSRARRGLEHGPGRLGPGLRLHHRRRHDRHGRHADQGGGRDQGLRRQPGLRVRHPR